MDTLLPSLIHLTGLFALGLMAYGYRLTNDTALRWFSFSGLAFFLVHMLLLQAWSTALIMGLALLMLWAGYTGKTRLAHLAWGVNVALLPLMLVLAYFGLVDPADIFPVVAGIVLNTGFLFLSGHALTGMIALGESLTILNALLVDSPYAAAANGLALLMLVWRTYRLWLTPTSSPRIA